MNRKISKKELTFVVLNAIFLIVLAGFIIYSASFLIGKVNDALSLKSDGGSSLVNFNIDGLKKTGIIK